MQLCRRKGSSSESWVSRSKRTGPIWTLEKFKVTFQRDMSENKKRRLQILFNGRLGVTTMDLNLDGLEAELA